MFSTLVSHSDGIFTRYSASTTHTNGYLQSDLIAFLSIVQKCKVDYLPISWQSALDNLGEGGSSTVSQSTFTTDIPLAFKRFHDSGDTDMDLLPLMSEVLILSQPAIQNHPNIVNLEGICWEIKPITEKPVPVLVFEKAAWDLQQFFTASEGMKMSTEDRLQICADIGSAIMTLHAYGVIHGDIKPQNVLVFKEATGKTTVKVADFGYSTLITSEDRSLGIVLPKSRPWNAPEHHFGEFEVLGAKKTDVYSFGMVCLWVLFGSSLPEISQTAAKGATGFISFDALPGPRTFLEQLKDDDQVQHIATRLIESQSAWNTEQRIRLHEFFSLTLPLNPEKRTSDIEKLVGLLSQERITLQLSNAASCETMTKLPTHADFQIAENLASLMTTDYRVRIHIRDNLEKHYTENQDQPFAAHIAFQIAFCYQVGFGVKSDANKCRMWLEKSNKRLDDLKIEQEAVQPVTLKSARLRSFQRIIWADFIHEYRARGLPKLEEARKEYEREIGDMTQEFGELHFTVLTLCSIFADLLDELKEFKESEVLRVRIRNEMEKTCGIDHPSTLTSMAGLASTYCNQGRWTEAKKLKVQVMETFKEVLGEEHPDTLTSMARLAFTYSNLGHWEKAKKLKVTVMETFKKVLGEEHPSTLASMSSLATTFWNQGQWKDAEELQAQVLETTRKIQGEEHPTTFASMNNLATIYCSQGRWKDAEKLLVEIIKTTKKVLGQDHPDSLKSIGNLASAYGNQGRWKEAEELEVQVWEMRQRVLGKEHPHTLATMHCLASTFCNQGRWNEALELNVQVVKLRKKVHGEKHPDTLTSMANLAWTYYNQGRWKEAERLFVHVVKSFKGVLGKDHPDTLACRSSLALILLNQGRWNEAEELNVSHMETFKRVHGLEHPDTLTSMNHLASIFWNQGRWEEAEKLFVQVVETFKRILGQEHPTTLTCMNCLATTYNSQGRWKKAEELKVQVMETRKRVLGLEHPLTFTSMNNLGSTFLKQGRWNEAEELFEPVMKWRKKVLGLEHPETLTSIQNLAVTYGHQGRLKEAEGLEVQVMETRKRVLGEEHPATLFIMHNLGFTYKELRRIDEAISLMAKVVALRSVKIGKDHPDTKDSMDALTAWRDEAKVVPT